MNWREKNTFSVEYELFSSQIEILCVIEAVEELLENGINKKWRVRSLQDTENSFVEFPSTDRYTSVQETRQIWQRDWFLGNSLYCDDLSLYLSAYTSD